jgi:hypothetical protein
MTQSAWDALPPDQQSRFHSIAAKDTSDMTAEEWFNHLVPEEIQDDPQKVDVFMDGGEVTTTEWVPDRGRGSGHYEEVTHELPDRDVSRIESGHNGGEYTADNTIMEDASVNRARGSENMTEAEYDYAIETNESAIELLEEGAVTTTATEAAEVTEALSVADIVGPALETAVVATVAYKAGKAIANQCDNETDAIGFGLLGAGGTVLLYANPVTGPLMWGGTAIYSGYKLCSLAGKLIKKFA